MRTNLTTIVILLLIRSKRGENNQMEKYLLRFLMFNEATVPEDFVLTTYWLEKQEPQTKKLPLFSMKEYVIMKVWECIWDLQSQRVRPTLESFRCDCEKRLDLESFASPTMTLSSIWLESVLFGSCELSIKPCLLSHLWIWLKEGISSSPPKECTPLSIWERLLSPHTGEPYICCHVKYMNECQPREGTKWAPPGSCSKLKRSTI